MVVHRGSVAFEGGLFGGVVLGAPAAAFHDGGDEDFGVVGSGDRQVVPDEAGLSVLMKDVDGEPVRFGGVDAGGLQDLADDGGPVGAVLGQGLAGPFSGDQDPAPAQAEVFTVVGLAGAVPRDQPGTRALGLDPVAEPVRTLR
jgi:hypothetical protein